MKAMFTRGNVWMVIIKGCGIYDFGMVGLRK